MAPVTIYMFISGGGISLAIAGVFSITSIICIIFLARGALLYGVHILRINGNGITAKNAVAEIASIPWCEVKGIYIYQFTGIEKIRIPYKAGKNGARTYRQHGNYNIGGTIVLVPKKIPTKWIFVDDGRGENGENLFEYFVPLSKGAIIRMRYKDSILAAIQQNYQKQIVEKTIEFRG